jgi:hypothetical protein
MNTLTAIIIIALLWSIAASLRRMDRMLRGATLEFNIYGDDGGGEHEPKANPSNVIQFPEHRAGLRMK